MPLGDKQAAVPARAKCERASERGKRVELRVEGRAASASSLTNIHSIAISNPSETHLPELTHVAGAKPNGRYVVSS
ncbi:hypothetical protein THAOC_09324 [Thalassiosira oceanica]|uniref:Uncharacterized protein n=1 Tax=Thalassiosira oceanica TaxID=159749 RepID=K0TFW7_THAOC|nr:hypothetical protein THAOC_09324 [Thalassiosira oceanica]|eukprot:EJK69422.1 hypothetical protein THAOC_09324 [Thalassiosira oceanica]